MIRIVVNDDLAQAIHRATRRERGVILLPETSPLTPLLSLDAVGADFFIGEAYYAHYAYGIRRYRANGDEKPEGATRWAPARTMPDWAARTRFRVTAVWREPMNQIDAELAARAGLPKSTEDPRLLLQCWWPKWHGQNWPTTGSSLQACVAALTSVLHQDTRLEAPASSKGA